MALDHEYVAARRVLLDALEALGAHRKAVVLVGAQAIYLHVGPGDLAVAPFTVDGDLAINPSVLDDEPILAETLLSAGFNLSINPGTWNRSNVPIDFLVPFSLGGSGRRSARLGPHGTAFARKAKGLEAAIIDNSIFQLPALEDGDDRVFDIAVAGPAALLVAKLHKISERQETPNRWAPKDGLDVLRILRECDFSSMAERLTALAKSPIAGDVTRLARHFLKKLFVPLNGVGTKMAVQASLGLEDAAIIAASCEALAKELLSLWPR